MNFVKPKSKSLFGPAKKIVLSKGTEFVRQSLHVGQTPVTQKANETTVNEISSSVVLISDLENVFSNAQQIFNLFSCFGDINKIILMHNLQKVLVEFIDTKGAQACVDNLAGTHIGNTRLKITYSKYQTIDIKKSFRNEASIKFNEIMTVPSYLNQSRSAQHSSKLLFEVNNKDNLKMIDLSSCVRQIADPVSVNTLISEEYFKLKLVASFVNKSTALLVLSKLHNSELKTAKI